MDGKRGGVTRMDKIMKVDSLGFFVLWMSMREISGIGLAIYTLETPRSQTMGDIRLPTYAACRPYLKPCYNVRRCACIWTKGQSARYLLVLTKPEMGKSDHFGARFDLVSTRFDLDTGYVPIHQQRVFFFFFF